MANRITKAEADRLQRALESITSWVAAMTSQLGELHNLLRDEPYKLCDVDRVRVAVRRCAEGACDFDVHVFVDALDDEPTIVGEITLWRLLDGSYDADPDILLPQDWACPELVRCCAGDLLREICKECKEAAAAAKGGMT